MRELVIVLAVVIIGLAYSNKETVHGHSITYLPYALIAGLALLEAIHFSGFPNAAALLLLVVIFIRWLTSKVSKR